MALLASSRGCCGPVPTVGVLGRWGGRVLLSACSLAPSLDAHVILTPSRCCGPTSPCFSALLTVDPHAVVLDPLFPHGLKPHAPRVHR